MVAVAVERRFVAVLAAQVVDQICARCCGLFGGGQRGALRQKRGRGAHAVEISLLSAAQAGPEERLQLVGSDAVESVNGARVTARTYLEIQQRLCGPYR